MIKHFAGDYDFLSNFYYLPTGLTLEHYYQASKTPDYKEAQWVLDSPSPATAKHRGKQVRLRSDWEDIKVDVMRNLLRRKFHLSELKEKLLATGYEELVEGNWWGDRFWGKCKGVGDNWLGILLMQVRNELREESKDADKYL
jgi:N-glycosidase YbiA